MPSQGPLEVCPSRSRRSPISALLRAGTAFQHVGLATPEPFCCNRSDQLPQGAARLPHAPGHPLSAVVDAAGGGSSSHSARRSLIHQGSVRMLSPGFRPFPQDETTAAAMTREGDRGSVRRADRRGRAPGARHRRLARRCSPTPASRSSCIPTAPPSRTSGSRCSPRSSPATRPCMPWAAPALHHGEGHTRTDKDQTLEDKVASVQALL